MKEPFELEKTEVEIYRQVSPDGKTIFVIERQIFNWTIKRYTDSWSWNTQW